MRMPRKTTLYDFRLNVDFCCMLYAREYVFTPGGAGVDWFTHFRLDSSPQFARNYLVGELDILRLHDASAATDDEIDSLKLVAC